MSLMRCRGCSTKHAVGLLRCPQCQELSELYAVPEHVAADEEDNMPKITVGGGASNALGGEEPTADAVEAPEAVADEPIQEEAEGEAEAAPAAEEAAAAPKTRKKAASAKS